MDNNLEKRIQQKDFNATPKIILENYLQLTDAKRINYEEQIPKYK